MGYAFSVNLAVKDWPFQGSAEAGISCFGGNSPELLIMKTANMLSASFRVCRGNILTFSRLTRTISWSALW
jgi:hypothetical protein